MEGEWEVKSTFIDFRTPLGPSFAHPGSIESAKAPAKDGGLGSIVTYRQRYDRKALKSPAVTTIVSDRAFNTKSAFNSRFSKFVGYEPIESVEYNPAQDINRLILRFSTVGPDMRPLPPKRIEIGINNRMTQDVSSSKFCAAELARQVIISPRRVAVEDYEVMWRWELQPDGKIKGRQRRVDYLQPQDLLYFDAKGRGVAIYDYDAILTRIPQTT